MCHLRKLLWELVHQDLVLLAGRTLELTLGQLKGKLEGLGVLSNEAIDQITSLNQTRRRLIHYFVPDYHDRMGTEDGRQEVLEELNAMEEKFRNAWYGLQNFLAAKALERGYNA